MRWHMAPAITGLGAATAVCVFAIVCGGRLERQAAVWVWAAWVMTPALQLLTGEIDPARLFLVVDATLLGVLATLTWRSGRRWPAWAVAIQGLIVALDLLRLLLPGMDAWAYLTAMAATSYLLLAPLAAGAWSAWRRRTAPRPR